MPLFPEQRKSIQVLLKSLGYAAIIFFTRYWQDIPQVMGKGDTFGILKDFWFF
jgi:hypothetical protein